MPVGNMFWMERSLCADSLEGKFRILVQKMLPFLALLAAWQGLALVVLIGRGIPFPFPTPLETLLHFCRLLAGSPLLGSSIYLHLGSSLGRWLLGFALAAIVGMGIGVLTGWIQGLDFLFLPFLSYYSRFPAWPDPVAILLWAWIHLHCLHYLPGRPVSHSRQYQ